MFICCSLLLQVSVAHVPSSGNTYYLVLSDDGTCAAETCSSNEEQMYIVSDILNI
jgi:hypothetical protein